MDGNAIGNGTKRRHSSASKSSVKLLNKRVADIVRSSPDMKVAEVCESLCNGFPEYERRKRGVLYGLINDVIQSLAKVDVSDSNGMIFNVSKDQQDKVRTESNDALHKQKKRERREQTITEIRSKMVSGLPGFNLGDLGGIDNLKSQIMEYCRQPLFQHQLFKQIGVSPPSAILIHGPVGVGKTKLAHAIAGELQLPFISVNSPELISNMSGESEKKIKKVFLQAKKLAPSILFIDELDAILANRDREGGGVKAMEKRIVTQFLNSMDDLQNESSDDDYAPVLVLGATSRLDQLDPSLRQTNRFEREIFLTIPDFKGRISILEKMSSKMKLSESHPVIIEDVARNTPGFVAADLQALCKGAASLAVARSTNLNSPLEVCMQDFTLATLKIQPNVTREGFVTVPKVTWADIGSLHEVREELTRAITDPLMNPEKFERFNLAVGGGVLLYGPPGCGKTLVAKAVANQSQANFLSVKGPELMNKYVGESERGVRQLFNRARASAPCVVFFDEIDSLCPRRGGQNGEASGGVQERVVNQLLTEMDGIEERKQVFIIAATNRPDIIDPALLRPGRLERRLFVPLPDTQGRNQILKTLMRNLPMSSEWTDEQVLKFAGSTRIKGFSGADLAALVKESSLLAIRSNSLQLEIGHFEGALNKVTKSVEDPEKYEWHLGDT